MIRLLCHANGAAVTNFTDGKVYDAVKVRDDLRVLQVHDDFGIARIVLPGEPSPHLLSADEEAVGKFEIV